MGGQPRDPGQDPYPLSPSHKFYVNRYQNPTLFNDVEIKRLSGFEWQQFFYFRDTNIAPFANSPAVNGGQRYGKKSQGFFNKRCTEISFSSSSGPKPQPNSNKLKDPKSPKRHGADTELFTQ